MSSYSTLDCCWKFIPLKHYYQRLIFSCANHNLPTLYATTPMEKVRLERSILDNQGEPMGSMMLLVDKDKYDEFINLLANEQDPISPQRKNELMDQVFLRKK